MDFGKGRRSSKRSIKRKKFDDELVESSLTPSQPKIEKLIKAKTERHHTATTAASISELKSTLTPKSTFAPSTPSSATLSASLPSTPVSTPSTTYSPTLVTTPLPSYAAVSVATNIAQAVTPGIREPQTSPIATVSAAPASVVPVTSSNVIIPPVQHVPFERKRTKSQSRKKKPTKAPIASSTKDLGRWKPQDDLMLINAVQQTCDLTAVYLGCKFTCKFTLREIQERWVALLYDPVVSKLAIQAMKQLHSDVIAQVNAHALYSRAEEKLLETIASNHFQNSQPQLEVFSQLLGDNPNVFHPARTAKHLLTHWLLMKQYHLLPDQSVQSMPKGDHVLNFSDAEDLVNDEDLAEARDDALEHELSMADRRNKKEIRHLENELPRWQVLVDSVTGVSAPEFDNHTLAVLRGRLVRYLMRSKEITFGRVTKDNTIDVDLSLEGPAWKISRCQGIIKLKNNGDFYLANEGKRPVYVDGKPVMRGCKHRLLNNSVVEISCLRFIFLINQELVTMLRQGTQDAQKIHVA